MDKKNNILKSLIQKKESYKKDTTLYKLFEIIINDFDNDTNNNFFDILNLTKLFCENIENNEKID
jgi:hypothetical protein